MPGIEFEPAVEGRYDRQRLIAWWDQERLAAARVIVAGAGALGNEVLKLLALLGIGHILVVDFDRVSLSNLARTVLFREADVGRPKVEAAIQRVREINPQVEIAGVAGDLGLDVGLGDFRSADLVFGCLDSVNARWALNRKRRLAGVEWIDGGISDFHGQVTRYTPGAAACYECTFTAATYERFNRRYSCPYGLLNRQAEAAVPTTAVAASLVAALQVQEALYTLHGMSGSGLQPGQRLSVFLKPYRLLVDTLPVNLDCLAHEALPEEIAVLAGPSPSQPLRDWILAARRLLPDADRVDLPFELVVEFVCARCGARQSVLRPRQKVFQDEARCPECGEMRSPATASQVTIDSVLAELSLQELGLPPREILAFHAQDQIVYLQIEG